MATCAAVPDTKRSIHLNFYMAADAASRLLLLLLLLFFFNVWPSKQNLTAESLAGEIMVVPASTSA